MSLARRLAENNYVTALVVVAIICVSLAIGVGFFAISYENAHTCRQQQRSWDNRRDAWLVLTTPAVYPPTTDAALLIREHEANERNRMKRRLLLAGLGPRPVC